MEDDVSMQNSKKYIHIEDQIRKQNWKTHNPKTYVENCESENMRRRLFSFDSSI